MTKRKRTGRENNGRKKFEWGQSTKKKRPKEVRYNSAGVPQEGEREARIRLMPGED